MSEARYRVARLDELEWSGGWLPIRRRFAVGAFGVNAWRKEEDGNIIGEHDEATTGHEELYFISDGHATFTVDGEEIDAPRGTFVFVRDPTAKRAAVEREPGTTILSFGAKPGEAYAPLPWEENADIIPLFAQGEYAQAKERLEQALERYPAAAGLLYNLACAEARLEQTDPALEHLRQAIELQPTFRKTAAGDSDFDSIRDEPEFVSAVAGEPNAGGAGA